MIVCNGCPKTGTNLLQRLCGMLGFRDSERGLIGFGPHAAIGARQIVEEDAKVGADAHETLRIGNDHFCHAHVTDVNWCLLGGHKILVAYRDPRDSAVSLVRWLAKRGRLEQANEAALIDLLRNGYWPIRSDKVHHTWVWFVWQWQGWRVAPVDVLPVEFAEMGRPETVRRIAAFLGADCDAEEVAAHWLGDGKVYRGRAMYKSMSSHMPTRSHWRDWWSDDVEQAWRDTRGPELLEAMGYE